jgi:hypothetical protein
MKKSELKKRLIEALTPDEAAKVEPKYKETYAAMIKGKGPLKLKKYDNPDKVVRGRVVNTIKNESLKIAEKLGKTADVGDYKDDFRKSDAPQFKGKSKKKRDQMATAAFLNKEEQKLDEIDNLMNETGQEIAKKNMDDYKRLNELVKAALMKETSTDKYDDNPALKGKQSDLPDGLQKAIIKKADGKVDETEINEMKMMDFAKLAKKVKDATEFIEKVASQLGNQSPEGEKALTSMYNSLKTMEESESTIDEIAPIKDYPGQIKNNIKANVKSVKTFADEILRHIDAVKAEEPQGDQYVDNPKIKMAITNLKSVAGEEESLSERILKELRK